MTTFEQFQNFEIRKHKEFFLPYYQEKNWQVIEDKVGLEKSDWDVKLEIFSGVYKLVDEKVRQREYDDCLIELIQDLKTGKLGWILRRVDWILYGSWIDLEKKYPTSLYLIEVEKLKQYILEFRGKLKTIISADGWGVTWNVVIAWKELIKMDIVKKLI